MCMYMYIIVWMIFLNLNIINYIVRDLKHMAQQIF
jgi:hypothetical protein